MDEIARRQADEMAETSRRTLSDTFGWATQEERLYRECPTAFWLAPDGDGALPPPPASPMPPAPIVRAARQVLVDPVIVVGGMATGVLRAMMAAGPIFAATAMLLFQSDTDGAWWEPIGRALMSLAAFPVTILFGAALAVLPVLAGVAALGLAGKSIETLRSPAAWSVTGGFMGAAISTMTDAGGSIGLALIATSTACAAIARTAIDWTEAGSA